MTVIDAHQHFWRIDNPGHQWPDAGSPLLHRDFLPHDLQDDSNGTGVVGTVLVQSQPDDRDTNWMIAITHENPLVMAVVGWVDLAARQAPERIAELARHPKLRGLRPMLQAINDTEWILHADLSAAIEAMIDHGLRFDALVQPRHLAALAKFAARWPELPIVIDHGAKPRVADGTLDPWRDEIAALAALPNVHCKLSGLRTEQAPGQGEDALRPYVAHLCTMFGDRLMWGSDWPVLLEAKETYSGWLAGAERLAAPIDAVAHDMLFQKAATRFYSLSLPA